MKNNKMCTHIISPYIYGRLFSYVTNLVVIFLLSSASLFSQSENKIYTGGVIPISKEEYEKLPKVNWDTLRKYSNPDAYIASSSRGSTMLITPPAGDQGTTIGSCVGWAVGYTALGILTYPKYNCWSLAKRSPGYVFNQIAYADCLGTSMTLALDLVTTEGSCSWNLMPYTQYSCSTQPNVEQTYDASKNKALEYATISRTDVSAIKAALDLGHPVIVGHYQYDSYWAMWNGSGMWESFDPDENKDGLHAVVIIGYDDNFGSFKIQNSRGSGGYMGEGRYWVKYNMVTQGLFEEAYVLYGMDLTQYPEELTGPRLVCPSGATFTVNHLPTNCTISWGKSSNLTLSSTSANTATFSSNSSGQGWIEVTINSTSCSSHTLPRHTVWSGTPQFNISGPYEGCPNVQYTFEATPKLYSNPSYDYSWAIYPNDGNISTSNGGKYAYITFYNPYSISGYDVKVRAQNACGLGDYSIGNIWIHECYDFMLSPNPASDIVTITRVVSEGSNTKVISSGENTIYNIKIIDFYGTLHYQTIKSGDSFTIPVSGLKDGNYNIQITIGDKTSTLKLVVKH